MPLRFRPRQWTNGLFRFLFGHDNVVFHSVEEVSRLLGETFCEKPFRTLCFASLTVLVVKYPSVWMWFDFYKWNYQLERFEAEERGNRPMRYDRLLPGLPFLHTESPSCSPAQGRPS